MTATPLHMTTFSEGCRAQLVNALSDAETKQVEPIKFKSGTELEADRAAAALALNAGSLREHELRHGKAVRKPTAFEQVMDALANALERASTGPICEPPIRSNLPLLPCAFVRSEPKGVVRG